MVIFHCYVSSPEGNVYYIVIYNPYGSKYLPRKCLGYDLGGYVPSETVFGSIGNDI